MKRKYLWPGLNSEVVGKLRHLLRSSDQFEEKGCLIFNILE